MCTPDLNIYSYHWVAHSDHPIGYLYTPHQQCIDWDAFFQWQHSQTISTTHGAIWKPTGADVLY